MNKAVALIALVGIVALVAGLAVAADREAPTTTGTVVKIDGKNLILKVAYVERATGKEATKEQTIATTDKTAVTLDGKDAKLADLKEGMTAVVTYAMPEKPMPGASLSVAKVEAKSAAK